MEGDSRNPRVSLLKKYDIPVDHLSYEYVQKCSDKRELERIVRILRSGEEGFYPDLLRVSEECLRKLAPESRVLRVETPILTKEIFTNEEWRDIESKLSSWEEEMKVMDSSLNFEKSRMDVVGNKNLPGVRKVTQPPAKSLSQNSIKIKSQTNNKNERIKAGDYAAWDKFDVDKELLKLDIEEERKQEENERKKKQIKKQTKEKKVEIESFDKESYSPMEQQVLANQAKDRGNECYKSGDYESALKYYDISINFYATANAFNNRAMTYLKLKEYKKAVLDCNRVLNLEENNVKALHRRATAYQNLSSNNDSTYDNLAWIDLSKIVRIEPNNKAVQADLQKLKKKLGLEDVGKKFRMPIYEGDGDATKTLENKSKWNVKDESINVDNLPLTYYGPSTSTFQCEPYSRIHRALVGSGQIMCKCNSNIPRQNPLCQRCGEAMSTPKPSKKPKPKELSDSKKDNENKNCLLKEQSESAENKSPKCISQTNDALKVEPQEPIVDEGKEIEKNESESITFKEKIEEKNSDAVNDCTKVSESKEISDLSNATNNTKIENRSHSTEESSSQVSNHVSKKSRNKKKKSKDRKHLEPVKIVHAAKYLQPTGVEPKVKSESSERKEESGVGNQFKEFVPNRKCLGGVRIGDGAHVPSDGGSKPTLGSFEKDLSFEGNKENIAENRTSGNVNDGSIKKESTVTGFEFIKTWEELRKCDEGYTKRAEIIRMIQPSDLGKVIGMKLDSDMLSCLLKCLERHFVDTDPKLVADFLKQLPQIPRFGLVNMFLADADKKILRKLIESTEKQGFGLSDDMKRIVMSS